jgi:ATP-dependent helicase/nuclease subunit A
LPAWSTSTAPPEARPPRPLAPSALAEDREPAIPPTAGLRAAAERGTVIHQLLERLPDVPPGDRRDRALVWLERTARIGGEEERETLADLVCGLLSDPAFAPLFGPGSLGEAPIAATLPDGRVVAGTVDRLLVEEARVSVIDFKTGRQPATAGEIPATHRAQIKAYSEALAVIFPGRTIRSALLYTAGPALFEIDG